MVLVHGVPASPALWRHVVPRLEGCRRLAWKIVGYGASIPQRAERDISVAAQAAYLTGWMAHLGLEPAILARHDLGGGVVQIGRVRDRARCADHFYKIEYGDRLARDLAATLRRTEDGKHLTPEDFPNKARQAF